MIRFTILAASLALCGLASATTPGNNGGGNGGCGQGQQTNGCGSSGGQGGAGGSGVGIGIAGAASSASATSGAAVVGSGNSTNRNTNAQGQQQGQAQSSRNSNRNTSTSGGNTVTGGAVSTGAVTVAVEGAHGDAYVAAAQERNPVATAYAAPLTSSPETCMGSSTGGAQGANFGVTFGTTWESVKCDRRMNARALRDVGQTRAALALLCQDADIAKAMEAAGGSCPANAAKTSAVPAASFATPATQSQAAQYQDPIIRARLGLPPL